jgi:hypothetical protein
VLDCAAGTGITVATGDGVLLLERVQAIGPAEERADIWALRRGIGPGAQL